MILIFSEENEFSTCDIIDWLEYYNNQVIRINGDHKEAIKVNFTMYNDTQHKIILEYNGNRIDLDKVTSFWYRRGGHLRFYQGQRLSNLFTSKLLIKEIAKDLMLETRTLSTYIHKYLSSRCFSIGSIENSLPNKLEMLKIADNTGLTIPKTLITTSKKRLEEFIAKEGEVITKAIGDALHFLGEDEFYCVYTELVTDLDIIPETFFPSLFQQKLEKKYELRTFYLHGEMYSMAIFSQNNTKTEIDFRKYDEEVPNRNVPYKLPNDIEDKIDAFMKAMNLNTGSIDLIFTENNQYVFLEVNPVGQFGMVSTPCNYYLERTVAKKLIHHE
ncbi:grasp-with-spasm system ATP-grasp peptide maturase [Aquimarina celericrescens]|uniref:Grasp-with-spasm system ATP-grasp peptide maturase n=1 Tax=Aquimarina celericrescens TaxID=1964542 RepID=A0ABW5AUE3_9FLAO|nr:grasp-with-spasm system ATP-grasp peptide maturase [Aquimarina celericrescens]